MSPLRKSTFTQNMTEKQTKRCLTFQLLAKDVPASTEIDFARVHGKTYVHNSGASGIHIVQVVDRRLLNSIFISITMLRRTLEMV